MNFTENDRKLLINSSGAIQMMMSRDGLVEAAEALEELRRAVASERAEPTATEPEVPGEAREKVVNNAAKVIRAWRKQKMLFYPLGDLAASLDALGMGDDVTKLAAVAHEGDPCVHCGIAHDDVPVGPCAARAAPDVPYTHCSACGMRSHGTNAELRAEIKAANQHITRLEVRYLDGVEEIAKLREVIEAEANYRLCMDVYLFDGDGAPYDDYGHSYRKLLKEIHQARTKADLDQREAKGDGDDS